MRVNEGGYRRERTRARTGAKAQEQAPASDRANTERLSEHRATERTRARATERWCSTGTVIPSSQKKNIQKNESTSRF